MSKKHGYVGTPLYRSWYHMKDRCDNPNNKDYIHYGGRGIKYAKDWKDFISFKDWALVNGHSNNLTIERINNDRNYCPENCRWATRAEQSQNTRITVLYNGESAAAAARRLGGSPDCVAIRIRLGWSKERAFMQPIRLDSRNRK
jgi:hypothetical protein